MAVRLVVPTRTGARFSTMERWAKLAKNLKAEIDEERIEAYRGTVSLPVEAGGHERVAVKIVEDRGFESLNVMALG